MRHTLGLGNDRGDADGIGFVDTLSALNQALRSEVEQYSPRPAGRRPRARNRVMASSMGKGKKGGETYCLGLKAIAEYLGNRLNSTITIRTVSRWIQNRGLPVKKIGFWTAASQHDLDEWIDM